MIAKFNWYLTVLVLAVMCSCVSSSTEQNQKEIFKQKTAFRRGGLKLLSPDKSKKEEKEPEPIKESEGNQEYWEALRSDPSKSWEEVIKSRLQPEMQEFDINPAEDNFISCEKGTKIYVPEEAFDGQKVTLEVTEYYSKSDLFSADLPTVSNGNILESGGSLLIDAKQDGESVELDRFKELTIMFPKRSKRQMDTYYGERDDNGDMNWELDSKVAAASQNIGLFEGVSVTYMEMQEQGIGEDIDIGGGWTMQDNSTSITEHFNETFNEIDEDVFYQIKTKAEKEGNNSRYNIEEDNACCTVKFSEFGGKVDQVGFSTGFPHQTELGYHLKHMPPVNTDNLKLNDNNSISICFSFFKISDTQHEEYNQDLSIQQLSERMQVDKENALAMMGEQEIKDHILTTRKLGWINCDKRLAQGETTPYYVFSPRGMSVQYYLIFEQFNSMTSTRKFSREGEGYFRKLPEGEKVKVIGLSYPGFYPRLAVLNTEIDLDGCTLTDFRTFTMDELKEILDS